MFSFGASLYARLSVLIMHSAPEVQELIDNTVYSEGSSVYHNILVRQLLNFYELKKMKYLYFLFAMIPPPVKYPFVF